MQTRHAIDTSTVYRGTVDEPHIKMIEQSGVDPALAGGPLVEKVAREPYLISSQLEKSVNLAIALGRPLLLQGDPGSGKTRLAHAVAYALNLPLEEGYIKSTSRAQDLLYSYDAVARLYDVHLIAGRDATGYRSTNVDAEKYVRLGPLGRAIARASYGRRSVVLIDEIDKADIDYPNDLLRELDRLEFEVPEAPGLRWAVPAERPDLRPIIFVTNNEEKALPPAFLRRCVFHYVEFPADRTYLGRILAAHHVVDRQLRDEAISVLLRLRELDLSKKPGMSEFLDWVGYLQAVGMAAEDLASLPYLGALIKGLTDQHRVTEQFGSG